MTERTRHNGSAIRCRTRRHSSRGMVMLLVMAVLAVTVALVFSMSRATSTTSTLAAHESAGLDAQTACEFAAELAIQQLVADPNWMPISNPVTGKLATGAPYRYDVQISDGGAGRLITAAAQVLDPLDSRTLASRQMTIRLRKQPRDNRPRAAIAAFGANITRGSTVYIASGSTVTGNVRARGTIRFQKGFTLNGQAFALGAIASDGVGASHYATYRAPWGETYAASDLSNRARWQGSVVTLSNVSLGPTEQNPLGVFYYPGSVTLKDIVTINGTLAITGDLMIEGDGVSLASDIAALDPKTAASAKPFPAIVADGNVTFDPNCDQVSVHGLVLAGKTVRRTSSLNGPAVTAGSNFSIDIAGAVLANRVTLRNQLNKPLRLVFDAAKTDTTDAPGFFTWRVVDWSESN